jgi:hypothetical protein
MVFVLNCGKPKQILVNAARRNPYFCSYDTRAFKGYEGPCIGSEEVSLTSRTELPR